MCRFTKKCTGCDIVSNQGEERVADQLCIGLADNEIQEDPLKDPNQDMSVEETIRFVEIRASGKRSAVSMTTPTSTDGIDNDEGNEAISSAYRRQQRRPPSRPGQGSGKATPTRPWATTGTRLPQPEGHLRDSHHHEQPEPCPPNEARATSADSRDTASMSVLPTDASTAQHLARLAPPVAAKTTPPRCAGRRTSNTSAIYEQVDTMIEGTLNHQTWNQQTQRWTQTKSRPPPHLEVTVAAHREDFRQHGNTLRQETKALTTGTPAARVAWQDHSS